MKKRELTLNIRETNEQARRRVYKSKQLEKKRRQLGLRIASIGLAAGIIGDTVLNLWVNHYVDCKYPFLVKMKKEKRF